MSDMTEINGKNVTLRSSIVDNKHLTELLINGETVEVDYFGTELPANTTSMVEFRESDSAMHDMTEYIALALDIPEKQAAKLMEELLATSEKTTKTDDPVPEVPPETSTEKETDELGQLPDFPDFAFRIDEVKINSKTCQYKTTVYYQGEEQQPVPSKVHPHEVNRSRQAVSKLKPFLQLGSDQRLL